MALNFQQKSSVFLRRVLLVAFVIVSIVLVTVYSREGQEGPLHATQGVVSGIFAPLKFVGAATGSGIDAAAEGIDNITADESTLSGLRDYNAKLIEQFSQMEEYKQENERLRELLKIKDMYDINGVGAHVIAQPAGAWDQVVTIDAGATDGVTSGLTVMGTAGVVGQVVGTEGHSATVRLLSDSKSGAAAMVQSSRAKGIVHGSLEGVLYLENLEADAEVNLGDIVVTSGLGGSYTSGLVIGTVVKIDAKQGDATRRVVVSPNDTISSLEEVLVVLGIGQDDTADANDGEGGDAT